MQDTIKVHVVKYKTRPNLVMRYIDPLTGKQVAKTANTTRRRDAERAAAKWEAELREGRYQKPSRMTWAEFRKRYAAEKLATLSPRTLEAFDAAANHLERVVDPKFLARIDANVLSRFQASLIGEGMKLTTLASHLRSIRAALGWAERRGLIFKAPRLEMPKPAKGEHSMRGRPITLEEFERMLTKVGAVRMTGTIQRSERTDIDLAKRSADLAKFRRLLRGLWLSGLRLGEALQLSWDADAPIAVHLGGKYPALRIWAERKSRSGTAYCRSRRSSRSFYWPRCRRRSPGARVPRRRAGAGQAARYEAGEPDHREIGEAAKVVTDPNTSGREGRRQTGDTVPTYQYATAHDLRRAFGTRWSKRVMPATLQKLMRHGQLRRRCVTTSNTMLTTCPLTSGLGG